MSSTTSSRTVQQLLGGDVALISGIRAVPHDELVQGLAGRPLMLTEHAVTKVLRDLRAGRVEPGDVQQWASFVRRGYAPGAGRGPIQPLDIEYAPEFEDAIVEALARLDEIGDVVDGHLGPTEIDELLGPLEGPG